MSQVDEVEVQQDYLLVKEDNDRIAKENNIITVHDVEWEESHKGTVVKVGMGFEYPVDMKEGETVFYIENFIKARTMLDNQEYALIRAKDCLAVR